MAANEKKSINIASDQTTIRRIIDFVFLFFLSFSKEMYSTKSGADLIILPINYIFIRFTVYKLVCSI